MEPDNCSLRPCGTDFSIAAIMARRGHEKEREKHERRLTRRRASADSLLPLDKFATDTTSSVASSSPEPTTPIPTPRPIKTCPDDDSEDINCESPPQITSTVDSAASSGRSRSPPSSPPPPRNPLLQERFNCEELRNVVCHLETKDLWDKFNELGTEMIITKTGRGCRGDIRLMVAGAAAAAAVAQMLKTEPFSLSI
ncbi:hypothetical protein RUM44_006958 [Polyplax serrata]|uniref:T-box domain-containing protein n=1 Tax=Polyplax serrata TaxID=468196 RepID=A0ABR1AZC9_POLSC